MSETLPVPEWRARLALLGIVGLALGLRLWTIGSGIPYTVGVDEPEILRRAVAMMKTGDLNPHFFDYGGLTIYFHVAVASVRFALGALSADSGYTSLDRVWEGSFYLWARTATALVGTLLVYVVYRIGLRWNVRAGLIAAFFAAVHPEIVREAHFALTDTPLTFWVTLTLLLSMIAAEQCRVRWFMLAGITAGLATATKYNGATALAVPLTVAIIGPGVERRAGAMVAAAGGFLGAFFAGAPFSLLDLPEFLKGFGHLAASYNQRVSVFEMADRYFTYTRNSFSFGLGGWLNYLGWPALLCSLIGAIAMLVRATSPARRAAAAGALVFGLGYYWLISNLSLTYFRYALPVLPLLCVCLALGIVAVADFAAGKLTATNARRAAFGLLALLAVPPLWQATTFDQSRRQVTTQELTGRWLERNVPASDWVKMEEETLLSPPGYRWESTHQLARESMQSYIDQGFKYVVVSGAKLSAARESNNRHDLASYQQLFSSSTLMMTIQASADRPGPTLTILKLPSRQ